MFRNLALQMYQYFLINGIHPIRHKFVEEILNSEDISKKNDENKKVDLGGLEENMVEKKEVFGDTGVVNL